MNWIGGSRNRLKMSEEKRKQMEYFEKHKNSKKYEENVNSVTRAGQDVKDLEIACQTSISQKLCTAFPGSPDDESFIKKICLDERRFPGLELKSLHCSPVNNNNLVAEVKSNLDSKKCEKPGDFFSLYELTPGNTVNSATRVTSSGNTNIVSSNHRWAESRSGRIINYGKRMINNPISPGTSTPIDFRLNIPAIQIPYCTKLSSCAEPMEVTETGDEIWDTFGNLSPINANTNPLQSDTDIKDKTCEDQQDDVNFINCSVETIPLNYDRSGAHQKITSTSYKTPQATIHSIVNPILDELVQAAMDHKIPCGAKKELEWKLLEQIIKELLYDPSSTILPKYHQKVDNQPVKLPNLLTKIEQDKNLKCISNSISKSLPMDHTQTSQLHKGVQCELRNSKLSVCPSANTFNTDGTPNHQSVCTQCNIDLPNEEITIKTDKDVPPYPKVLTQSIGVLAKVKVINNSTQTTTSTGTQTELPIDNIDLQSLVVNVLQSMLSRNGQLQGSLVTSSQPNDSPGNDLNGPACLDLL